MHYRAHLRIERVEHQEKSNNSSSGATSGSSSTRSTAPPIPQGKRIVTEVLSLTVRGRTFARTIAQVLIHLEHARDDEFSDEYDSLPADPVDDKAKRPTRRGSSMDEDYQ